MTSPGLNTPTPVLLQGDARELPLADASVDLVCTSPPYFGLRDYGHASQIGAEPTPGEFLDALTECTREMVRVLKPTGSIWVNLGDKYAGSPSGPQGSSGGLAGSSRTEIYSGFRARQRRLARFAPDKSLLLLPHRYAIRCVDELGLVVRQDQVWSKPNGLPESVTDRTRRAHEYFFHLVKQPRYYSAVDEIREPVACLRHTLDNAQRKAEGRRGDRASLGARESDPLTGHTGKAPNPLGKLPGSVWEIATQPLTVPDHVGVDHFAAFPMEWPRRIILGWSPREVCTACGEGRRPLARQVDEQYAAERAKVRASRARTERERALGESFGGAGGRTNTGGMTNISNGVVRPDYRITGYACACPDTSAPSTPGIVLDPFSGTGTTALVAAMLGRTGIGVELSADYIRLARWRCSDPKERARAAGLDPDAVSKVRAELPGQVSLFDEAAS